MAYRLILSILLCLSVQAESVKLNFDSAVIPVKYLINYKKDNTSVSISYNIPGDSKSFTINNLNAGSHFFEIKKYDGSRVITITNFNINVINNPPLTNINKDTVTYEIIKN